MTKRTHGSLKKRRSRVGLGDDRYASSATAELEIAANIGICSNQQTDKTFMDFIVEFLCKHFRS